MTTYESKVLLTIVIAITLLLFSCGADAGIPDPDGYHIGTILGSDHWSDPYDKDEEPYNEDQWPSLYGGWTFGEHTHTIGFYENSYEDTSYFYHYSQRYNDHVEVAIGGVAGYDDYAVIPFLAVKFKFGPVWGGVFPGVNAYGLEHRW